MIGRAEFDEGAESIDKQIKHFHVAFFVIPENPLGVFEDLSAKGLLPVLLKGDWSLRED